MPMAIERGEVSGGDPLRLRARLSIPPGAGVVGQLGALDPNKGTSDLVKALARLNAGRPEAELIHLVLAGAATPDFEAFAAGLSESSDRWLRRLGPIPPRDVPDFYAALDVFAMPSRTDSFGIVFLEAWANSLPVVAASAGGVVEVVTHDRDGLLVPFGAVGELADAIERLLEDRSMARRLGRAGFEKVRDGFDWDTRYARLDPMVRELSRTVRGRSRRAG